MVDVSPAVVRRATGTTTIDNTSWTPAWSYTLSTNVASGDRVLWMIFVTSHGNSTLSTSSSGWTMTATKNVAGVAGTLFTQETTSGFGTTSAPAFVLTSSLSTQFSGVLLAAKSVNGGPLAWFTPGTANGGAATTANPPATTNASGADRQITLIITSQKDSNNPATSLPANFSNLTQCSGGNSGSATSTGERVLASPSGTVHDPANWPNPIAGAWVSMSFAIYEAPIAGGRPKVFDGTAFTAKPPKVWFGAAWVEKPLKQWNGTAWVLVKST